MLQLQLLTEMMVGCLLDMMCLSVIDMSVITSQKR